LAEPKPVLTPTEVQALRDWTSIVQHSYTTGTPIVQPGSGATPTLQVVATQQEASQPIVVGAVPSTGELILKDPQTGSLYFKKGTPAQVSSTAATIEATGKAPPTPYVPPLGETPDRPIAGTPTPEYLQKIEDYNTAVTQSVTIGDDGQSYVSDEDYSRLQGMAEDLDRVEVYDYKGSTVVITGEQATQLATLTGKDQFNLMESAGLIPEGSTYAPSEEDEAKGWGYLPPWIIRQQEKAREQAGEALKAQAEFKVGHQELPDGNYIPLDQWSQLSLRQKAAAMEGGWDALEGETAKIQAEGAFEGWNYKKIVEDTSLSPEMKERLIEQYYPGAPVLEGRTEYTFALAEAMEDPDYKAGEDLPPWFEEHREIVIETAFDPTLVKELALSAIPVYGTIRTWNSVGTAGKALGVIADLLWILPFVGGVSAGVRAGSSVAGRGWIGTATRSAKSMAIAEIKAPITAVMHPIRTAKGVLQPFETVFRPSALPLSGLEMRFSTQRIPMVGSRQGTMELRDSVLDTWIKSGKAEGRIAPSVGEEITTTITTPMALERLGPSMTHGTPDVRPFLSGAVADVGREGGVFLSPTLHTRFTISSAFGDVPEGGMRGAVIIRDQRVLSEIVSSQKIYKGMAEIEGKLPPKVNIPKPSQILMTRDSGGDKLALLIIGKPLSPTEIAKFKLVGSADLVRTIFKPTATIKSTSAKIGSKVDDLADINKELDALAELELEYARVGASRAIQLSTTRARITMLSRQRDVLQAEVRRALTSEGEYSVVNATDESVFTDYSPVEPPRVSASMRRDIEPVVAVTNRGRVNVVAVDRTMPLISDRGRVPPPIEDARVFPVVPEGERMPVELDDRIPTPLIPSRPPPPILDRRPPPGRPPRKPPPPVPPRVPPLVPEVPLPPEPPVVPIPPRFADDEPKREEFQKVPLGSIVWKHGWTWKVLPPPYDVNRIISLPKDVIPEGTTKFATGTGSAKATLQVIGGEVVPTNVDADLGIMDVHIRTDGKKSWMWFDSGGEQTVVGRSMASPTRGVTVTGKPEGRKYEERIGAERYRESPVSLMDEEESVGFVSSGRSPRRGGRSRVSVPDDGSSMFDRYYLGHRLPDRDVKGMVR